MSKMYKPHNGKFIGDKHIPLQELVEDLMVAYDEIIVNGNAEFKYKGFDTKDTGGDYAISKKLTDKVWDIENKEKMFVECAIQLGIWQGIAVANHEPQYIKIDKHNYEDIKMKMDMYELKNGGIKK